MVGKNIRKPMCRNRCRHCRGLVIRYGKRGNAQRFLCVKCGKIQQLYYRIKRKEEIDNTFLLKLHKEGMGISGISRILEISKSTVQRKLEEMASALKIPEPEETNQEYEVDELRTYIGNKKNECWVMYAINRKTKQVSGLVTGRRTKENLKKVINTLLPLNPRRIYTDGLNIYPGLIPENIHRKHLKILAFIERKNLTLRTHLKRLSRKTICYSKSLKMLFSSVKLYLFG